MNPRTYWNAYVERVGGLPKLSCESGIPYSTLAGINNGFRGVGRELAQRLVNFDPLLDKGILLQIQAIRARDTDEAA